MKLYRIVIFSLLLLAGTASALAVPNYKEDPTYKQLYHSMLHAFNSADSTQFFNNVKKLQDYLLQHDDQHAYYTQRCNEIIFLMNRKRIFEAYKLAQQLSKELREKKLDKEMYMAINMMGHIYRYCGNRKEAKRCFHEVIERIEAAGYRESLPAIYMNIVNVDMSENPEEALQMLNIALEIAQETSPERVFDIEARRTAAYYELGDTAQFLAGYKEYEKGVAKGLTSVHGRSLEVYYLAVQGKTDEAAKRAMKELDADDYSTIAKIYKDAGRWKEAYLAQERQIKANDSLNAVILSNSMQGIRDEYSQYEAERKAAKARLMALTTITVLLVLLIAAMSYIVMSRRRHIRQLNKAYQHALESDKMKSAFIQNVSHEVRTPLNIISGFAQVIADPNLDAGQTERTHMAQMVQKNTKIITTLIDEMLELSNNETGGGKNHNEDTVDVNAMLKEVVAYYLDDLDGDTQLMLESKLADNFTIVSNEMMIKHILNALLTNAIKNTKEGSIKVKADASDSMLTLTVEDTGCGIPEGEAERIFERFVKLDEFKVGIGLGLYLSRTTATKLGGNLVLDSSYKNGARFVVTLPVKS